MAEIDTDQVLRCVEPIWKTIPPTARRVLGRIEDVLSYATVHKYREGLNPARWDRGARTCCPSSATATSITTRFRTSRCRSSCPACAPSTALQRGHLNCCASRPCEPRRCGWRSGRSSTWTARRGRCQRRRMKKSTADHRVPLSDRAVEILRALPRLDDWVFPGAAAGKPIGSSTMLRKVLKPLRADCTVHGFRSTFRDWAAETRAIQITWSRWHWLTAIGTSVEKAYRRGDLLEKRKRLMQEWSAYCCGPALLGREPWCRCGAPSSVALALGHARCRIMPACTGAPGPPVISEPAPDAGTPALPVSLTSGPAKLWATVLGNAEVFAGRNTASAEASLLFVPPPTKQRRQAVCRS